MNNISDAINELKTSQNQLDQDGIRVGVSRQALEEVLEYIIKFNDSVEDATRQERALKYKAEGETAFVREQLRQEQEQIAKLKDALVPFNPDDEFTHNGIMPWDLEPHYINAMAQLTRRKAYDKGACAQLIAEKAKLAEIYLEGFNRLKSLLGRPLAAIRDDRYDIVRVVEQAKVLYDGDRR